MTTDNATPCKSGDYVTRALTKAHGQQRRLYGLALLGDVLLGDAMYWLAHGDGGRLLARSRMLDRALAACLIAELAVAEAIAIYGNLQVGFLAGGKGLKIAEELLGDKAFRQIQGFHGHLLELWLKALQEVSLEVVEDRLMAAGCARQRRSFARGRYALDAPPGVNRLRVSSVLTRKLLALENVDDSEAFVITLGMKAGIKNYLLTGASPAGKRYAEQLEHRLAPLHALLVGQVDTAIGDDALRPR